ncbi:MAG: hypothetical protein IVW56_07445 [Candidatus Binataceae bacterium]|nr:hypothetical protein [Candidatus Binataceae bacterium]
MIKASILFCAAMLACALTAGAATSTVATKSVSAVLSGTGVPDTVDVDPINGQCNFDTWVDQCPSGNDNCKCIQVTSPKATGGGKGGPGTVSDFFITIDNGTNPASEPAVGGGPNPRCSLYFGVLTLTSSGGGSATTQTLNLVGTACKHVVGISSKNQTGTQDKDLISGGWGISNDPAPSPRDESGWGEVSGQVIHGTNALTMHLVGDLSK